MGPAWASPRARSRATRRTCDSSRPHARALPAHPAAPLRIRSRQEPAEEQVGDLTLALLELEASGLRVTVEQGDAPTEPAPRETLKLELLGLDRPGIVDVGGVWFATMIEVIVTDGMVVVV